MFVYSVKSNQLKPFFVMSFVVLSIVVLVFLIKTDKTKQTASVEKSFEAETCEQRLFFLSSFGWKADEKSEEVSEVIIPEEFDEVYTSYNELQKQQGFDLSPFAGKRVKKWTYTIVNYPGYENRDCIKATLLVFDGQVIGGDICSVELEGFMHSFDMNQNEGTST